MVKRILHLLIAIDQLVYVVITLGRGYPDETLSSAAWRAERNGKLTGRIFRPLIDFLFLPFEDDHCYKSYLAEVNRNHFKDR